jgi:hypothetical protein
MGQGAGQQLFADAAPVVVKLGRLLLDNGPQPGMAVLLRDGKFAEIGAAEAVVAGWNACAAASPRPSMPARASRRATAPAAALRMAVLIFSIVSGAVLRFKS